MKRFPAFLGGGFEFVEMCSDANQRVGTFCFWDSVFGFVDMYLGVGC